MQQKEINITLEPVYALHNQPLSIKATKNAPLKL